MNSCAKWERLRYDIAQSILHSGTPGEGQDIVSLVKLYNADYSKMPIAILQHYLNRMKASLYKNKSTYLVDLYENLPIPDLLCYKKVQQLGQVKLVPVEEGGIPRLNRWNTEVKLSFFPTQANWKRKSFFRVDIKKIYVQQHYTSMPNKLDCYRNRANISFTFKREGELDDLIKNDKFIYVLRDIILTNIYKVNRITLCQEKVHKTAAGEKYQVLCGNPLAYSEFKHTTCSICWGKTFKDFIKNIQ